MLGVIARQNSYRAVAVLRRPQPKLKPPYARQPIRNDVCAERYEARTGNRACAPDRCAAATDRWNRRDKDRARVRAVIAARVCRAVTDHIRGGDCGVHASCDDDAAGQVTRAKIACGRAWFNKRSPNWNKKRIATKQRHRRRDRIGHHHRARCDADAAIGIGNAVGECLRSGLI